MKTTLQTVTIMAAMTALTACGGASSVPYSLEDGPITLPDASDDCSTDFRNSVQGSYNGQIEYSSEAWSATDPKSCTWEVALSVATELSTVGTCQISFEIHTNLISATPDCADLNTTGSVSGDYGVDEEAPQWPIELSFRTPQVTDPFKTYAPGQINQGTWEMVFDGSGNISTDQVSEMTGWSGLLVSFSDQPFQQDDGKSIGAGDKEND